MNNNMLIAIAALTLVFGTAAMAVGQNSYPASQFSYQAGQFGYRALGQPLAPPPSYFNGGLPVSAIGRFQTLGLMNGMNGFVPLWQPPYLGAITPAIASVPAAQLTVSPQSPAGAMPGGFPPGTASPAMQIGPPPQLPAAGSVRPAPLPGQARVCRRSPQQGGPGITRLGRAPAEPFSPARAVRAFAGTFGPPDAARTESRHVGRPRHQRLPGQRRRRGARGRAHCRRSRRASQRTGTRARRLADRRSAGRSRVPHSPGKRCDGERPAERARLPGYRDARVRSVIEGR